MKKINNIKKSILFIKYLKEEESECSKVCEEGRREFEESIRQAHYDFNIYDQALDTPVLQNDKEHDSNNIDNSNDECNAFDSDKNEKESSSKPDHPDWVKPLFRKVVMITHPDKVPESLGHSIRSRMMEIYMGSKVALDSREYVDLVILADDIDVSLPEKKIFESKIFDKKSDLLSKKIQNLKQSTYWIWANSSDEEKEKILKEFIKKRGWLSKESKLKRSRSGSGKHPGKSAAQIKKAKILKKKE